MTKEIIQCSVFPAEHEFNSDKFKASVLTDKFEECLRIGVTTGLSKTQEKFREGLNSMSVISHCLHEDIYNAIKNELSAQMTSEHFVFTSNISGNERLFFEYQGYAFIIKLADSTRNRTKQEDKIRNQELGCHVISMVYTLDTFRENINTLSLQYIKGQTTLWKYSIPTQQIVDVVEIESENKEIVAQKPRFKKTNHNKEAV